MTDRQTVAGAYSKIEAHEDICALRYTQINQTLSELKDGAKTHNRLLITALLALLGWAGVQLWNTATHPTPPPVAAAVAAAK